jgi:hypothetical protein
MSVLFVGCCLRKHVNKIEMIQHVYGNELDIVVEAFVFEAKCVFLFTEKEQGVYIEVRNFNTSALDRYFRI